MRLLISTSGWLVAVVLALHLQFAHNRYANACAAKLQETHGLTLMASQPLATMPPPSPIAEAELSRRLEQRCRLGSSKSCTELRSLRAATPPPPPAAASLGQEVIAPIRTFKFKGELPFLLEEERHRVGVEVGVFKGSFSRWMLDHWPTCTQYYMVDLWASQAHYRQMDSASDAENQLRFELAQRNVAPFQHKTVLIRKASVAAAADFADGSVDFVYLDARHTFDAVTEDLEAWWPKLRLGGLLAGEDYMDVDEVWS